MFKPIESISARFFAMSAGTAVVAFVCFIGLVAFQYDRSLERQGEQLKRSSVDKISQTLDADIHLATARLDFLFKDVTRRVEAIASRTDTHQVVDSRNVVAIWEMMGVAKKNAGVDAIVVLDYNGKVIGASSDRADLIGLDNRLPSFSFYEQIKTVLKDALPNESSAVSVIVDRTETGGFIPGQAGNALSQIVFVPLFDDFGDVSGGLLAQRWIRPQEQLLGELAKINQIGLSVRSGGESISQAGLALAAKNLGTEQPLNEVSIGEDNVIRCGASVAPLEVCALRSIDELLAIQS